VQWPGKPGAAAPAAPLTAEEQQRFTAGQAVYASLCAACHGEDGRGREKLGPALAGSELALGPAGIAVRVLLNGKEGSTGLMPPLGSSLSDDQVAGVLTYVRRSWGNAASPVDAGSVKETRTITAGRTLPWTNEELLAIPAGGRGGQR
jgi:mono/diheme cytochrome c family protein